MSHEAISPDGELLWNASNLKERLCKGHGWLQPEQETTYVQSIFEKVRKNKGIPSELTGGVHSNPNSSKTDKERIILIL